MRRWQRRIDAFERITTVIPDFGYAHQDRKDTGRVPITAKLAANLIAKEGADRALTMDWHAAQIQGFFDVPVDHLDAAPVLDEYFRSLNVPPEALAIVRPDEGSIKRAPHHPTTHAVFCGNAVARLQEAPIREAVATNSLPIENQADIPNLKLVSVAP